LLVEAYANLRKTVQKLREHVQQCLPGKTRAETKSDSVLKDLTERVNRLKAEALKVS